MKFYRLHKLFSITVRGSYLTTWLLSSNKLQALLLKDPTYKTVKVNAVSVRFRLPPLSSRQLPDKI